MNKYILVYNMSWFLIPLKSMFYDNSVHCTAWLTNMQAQSDTNEYLPEGEFFLSKNDRENSRGTLRQKFKLIDIW